MRTMFIAIAALGLAAAGQSFAQPAAPSTVTVKDPAKPTHEECTSVIGRKMDGRVLHDHSAEKGSPRPAVLKALTKAEMDKMHGACEAKMAAAKK
jgi:phosphate-selective porin